MEVIFSWLGPILVVISLALPNVMWFRILNLVGSTIAAIYSATDQDWSFVFMNGTIALINIYWIWRLTRQRRVAPVPEPAVSGEAAEITGGSARAAEDTADGHTDTYRATSPAPRQARPSVASPLRTPGTDEDEPVDLDALPEIEDEPAPAAGLVRNDTIDVQLSHRTIRAFTDQPLAPDVKATLLDVARHAPTSSFYQACTIIEVTDPSIREVLHQSSGQPYVGGNKGSLFVFVIDLSRIARIREAAELPMEPIERPTLFLEGVEDCMIAAQNMAVAAESLGLGVCYLGSITRDVPSLIAAMKLPEFTFPLVGMLVGHPGQHPQKKPRLPREITLAENTYPDWDAPEYRAAMTRYDQVIRYYYDTREGGRRQDSYTHQMSVKPGRGPSEQIDLLAELRDQGLCEA